MHCIMFAAVMYCSMITMGFEQGAGQETCAADWGTAGRSSRVCCPAGQLCAAAAQPKDGKQVKGVTACSTSAHILSLACCSCFRFC